MPARCTLEQPCSVPLSRFTLAPSSAADVAPTPSFCLFLPPGSLLWSLLSLSPTGLPPLVSSALRRELSFSLSFALSIVFHSPSRRPFRPSLRLRTSLTLSCFTFSLCLLASLSLPLASLSPTVGLGASVLLAPSDRRRFSFFHRVRPSLSHRRYLVFREQREKSHPPDSLFLSPSGCRRSPPCALLSLPSSFSLPFRPTSSTSVRDVLPRPPPPAPCGSFPFPRFPSAVTPRFSLLRHDPRSGPPNPAEIAHPPSRSARPEFFSLPLAATPAPTSAA